LGALRERFEARGFTRLAAALAEAGLHRTAEAVQHAAAGRNRGRALGN
jgi:hypothetical protein